MQSETSAFEASTATSEFEKKEDHCYICEDGGPVVECTLCGRCFCYDVIGEKPADADYPGCVTVPAKVAKDEDQAWPCPDCLSSVQARTAPYIINRGARKTMRLASPNAVVLVVFYIHSLQELARSLLEQIQAVLGVFEMNVAATKCLLHHDLLEEDEKELRDQLAEGIQYHLAVVFVTESNPGGGWWQKAKYGSLKPSQAEEGSFLARCMYQVRRLARGALTSRLFGVVCGMNLPGEGVVNSIQNCLTPKTYLLILLPTVSNLQLGDFVHMLPELFFNLYYFGSDLRSAVHRVWAKSAEVRHHTGLLIVDRKTAEERFSITKLMYSPPKHRPFGVDLPEPGSICGCPKGNASWSLLKEIPHGREVFFLYASKCNHVGLHVAIYPGRRRAVVRFDCKFTEEDWNPDKCSFDFKESTMVRMKTFEGRAALNLNAPWTIAGRQAARQQQVPSQSSLSAV
ncbi:hypothetical protein FRC08_011023 [Ceratobasidium sp. 394]|nr:hypothetical protein FRC08_011023 [Ceratobasidium sp. 394]